MNGTTYACAICGEKDCTGNCLATTIKHLRAELDDDRRRGADLCALLNECHAELASNLSQIVNDYENIPPDGEGMIEAKRWIDRLTDILARIDAAVQEAKK